MRNPYLALLIVKIGGKMKNEPAFPVPNSANVNGQAGMTLRDYFAAAALPALIKIGFDDGIEAKDIVADAYFYADKMLTEREK
jgi:hypothetical protein